jgi:hypothetical protein
LSDLPTFLIGNLTILCFSELFSKLACRFRTGFGLDTDLVLAVLNDQPDLHASFVALRDIFRNPDCKAEIEDPVFFRVCELSIALIDDRPLVAAEGFQLLSILMKREPEEFDCFDTIRETVLNVDLGNRSRLVVPSVLAIEPKAVEKVIDAFFIERNTTFFNEGVARALEKLPVEVLQEFATKYGIMKRLMDKWGEYVSKKVDGHVLFVVDLLRSKQIACPPEIEKEWQTFVEGEVAGRSALVNRPMPFVERTVVEVSEVPIRRESNPRPRPLLNLLKT